jgi:hypothetical protein
MGPRILGGQSSGLPVTCYEFVFSPFVAVFGGQFKCDILRSGLDFRRIRFRVDPLTQRYQIDRLWLFARLFPWVGHMGANFVEQVDVMQRVKP